MAAGERRVALRVTDAEVGEDTQQTPVGRQRESEEAEAFEVAGDFGSDEFEAR